MAEEKQTKSLVPLDEGKLVPQDLDGLWRLAVIFADAGMVPKDDVKKPEKVFCKMAYGLEVGLSYMASLRSIALVNGTPSVYGPGFRAIIQRSGELESLDEYFELDGERMKDHYEPGADLSEWPDALAAVCIMKRKGFKAPFTGRFSVADGKRMGKWNKKTEQGYMSVWQKHPKDMLSWRALHKAADKGFSDITSGLVPVEIARDYEADLEPAEENGDTYEVPTVTPNNNNAIDKSIEKFDTHFAGKEKMNEFVELVAKHSEMIPEKIKIEACEDLDGFNAQYTKWLNQQTPQKEEPVQTAPPEPKKKVVEKKKEDPAPQDRPTKNEITDKVPDNLTMKAMLAATKKTLQPLVEANVEILQIMRMSNPDQYRTVYQNWKKWYIGKPWPLIKQESLFMDEPEADEVMDRMKQYFPRELDAALTELKMAKNATLSPEAISVIEQKVIEIIHKGKAKR